MEKVDLVELSNDGEKEVKVVKLNHKGKEVQAIIVMDFALYRKAFSQLLDTKMVSKAQPNGTKAAPEVEVETDILGAGDKLLFMGWHSGDEVIRKNMRLRAKAGQELGEWLMSIVGEDEDEADDTKKK